jgi:hypothetical protein
MERFLAWCPRTRAHCGSNENAAEFADLVADLNERAAVSPNVMHTNGDWWHVKLETRLKRVLVARNGAEDLKWAKSCNVDECAR